MKTLTKQTKDAFLVVNIDTERYFSITGELWSSKRTYKKRNDKYMFAAGCIHDEILKHFPSLKQVVKMHLSDLNGKPMHANANGYYFYQIMQGTAKYHKPEANDKEKYFNVLAEHLRVSDFELFQFVNYLNSFAGEDRQKIEFTIFVGSLIPQWEKEAKETIEFINTL